MNHGLWLTLIQFPYCARPDQLQTQTRLAIDRDKPLVILFWVSRYTNYIIIPDIITLHYTCVHCAVSMTEIDKIGLRSSQNQTSVQVLRLPFEIAILFLSRTMNLYTFSFVTRLKLNFMPVYRSKSYCASLLSSRKTNYDDTWRKYIWKLK